MPSGVSPTTYRGIIEVRNANNDDVLGYISKNLFGGSQYIIDIFDSAVIVNFVAGEGAATSTQIEITTEVNQIKNQPASAW